MEKPSDLIVRDFLAIERTRLANERTFLSYFRTFVVMLSSGFAILHLELFDELKWLFVILLVVAPIILFVGIGRLIYVKLRIRKYYTSESPK